MKALVCNGPRDITVPTVPDPGIDRPGDAVIQIIRTNICGSGLHMYEGRTDMEPGRVLGHEAEYLLVPWADFNCLRLPEDAEEKLDDYVMLADIFPTGYHATEMAGVGPGKSVVHPNTTLNNLVRSVRFTGSIGVVGVYVPADPGGPDELARWFKGQRMGTGQCPSHTGPSGQRQHKGPGGNVPSLRRAVSLGAPQIRLSAVMAAAGRRARWTAGGNSLRWAPGRHCPGCSTGHVMVLDHSPPSGHRHRQGRRGRRARSRLPRRAFPARRSSRSCSSGCPQHQGLRQN